MSISVCYATLSVGPLAEAEQFYTEVLGFKRSLYYEPTQWVAFELDDGSAGFAISESLPSPEISGTAVLDFFVDDIEPLWQRLKTKVDVVSELQHTPWGSYKFVIRDPSGNQLGFVARST